MLCLILAVFILCASFVFQAYACDASISGPANPHQNEETKEEISCWSGRWDSRISLPV